MYKSQKNVYSIGRGNIGSRMKESSLWGDELPPPINFIGNLEILSFLPGKKWDESSENLHEQW